MESKTQLQDPASSSADRTVWRIAPGIKFLAAKIRVGNFRILNNSSLPVYFGTEGIYSLLTRISIQNLEGSEIDSLFGDALQMSAIRLLTAENAQEYSINRQLAQNMCCSVTTPSLSQIALTEKVNTDSATILSAYIDISAMLSYLKQRVICDEGLIIQLEWNVPSFVQNGYSYDRPPCLMFDEVISNLEADKAPVYVFPTIISERLAIPVASNIPGVIANTYQRRLNSYYGQYLQRMYFALISDPNDPEGTKGFSEYNVAFAAADETLLLYVDGRLLIPGPSSVNTSAKKLAYLTDFNGPICLPGLQSYYPDVSAYGTTGPNPNLYGLTNPNTGIKMNGVLSFGCVKIAQFITNDLTIEYSATLTGPSNGYVYLSLMTEVLRTYNKETGITANLQLPPQVNTI
jgi:hypothetical protein